MTPKDKKKKKKTKAPVYLTGETDLAPFGVQADQLVRNALGLAGTVLGVKPDSEGQTRLWVKYASGLEAPVETSNVFAGREAQHPANEAAGLRVSGQAAHVQRTIAALKAEHEELAAKWAVYNADQAKLRAEADKKKKKKKAPAPPPADAVAQDAADSAAEAPEQLPGEAPSSVAA